MVIVFVLEVEREEFSALRVLEGSGRLAEDGGSPGKEEGTFLIKRW